MSRIRPPVFERLRVILYVTRLAWLGELGWLHERCAVTDLKMSLVPRDDPMHPVRLAEIEVRQMIRMRANDFIEIRREDTEFGVCVQGRLLSRLTIPK